jgi:mono/diheme cytochrome c family protein
VAEWQKSRSQKSCVSSWRKLSRWNNKLNAVKKVYDASCAACHGAKGEGGVGKPIAGSQIATGPVDGHLKAAVNGVPGTAMQALAAS